MKRKWKVEEKSVHPILRSFDKYISLFIVPLLMFIYAIFIIKGSTLDGWNGVIAGIWILLAIISSIAIGIFFLLNRYWLKWRLNWWKNVLLSLLLVVVSSFIFGLIIRSSN